MKAPCDPVDPLPMRALSIRQPYAELILRGIKRIEYRSRRTRIIGERFYIYAAKGEGTKALRHEGTEGSAVSDTLAPALSQRETEALPRGVIVGTAIITGCERNNGQYQWHLSDVKRVKRPRKPKGMPQPVWFTPF